MRRKQFEKVFNKNKEDQETVDLDDDFQDEIGKIENKKYEKFSAKKTDALKQAYSKYKGKKVNYEDIQNDEEDEESEIGEMNEDEEFDENMEEKEGEEENEDNEASEIEEDYEEEENLEKKSNKENPKLEPNKDNMDKDDEEYLKKITNYTPSEIRKGKNVQNQKNLFDFFISVRISLQKIMTSVNSLPQGELLKKFIDNTNIHVLKCTVSDLLKLLTIFITFQKEMITKNNYFEMANQTNSNVLHDIKVLLKTIAGFNKEVSEEAQTNKYKLEEIINNLSTISDKLLLIYEKIINIWYRKTLVYSYKSNTGNKILKILDNNFCEHLKKNIDSNYENIRQKSKKKSGEKILGKKHRPATDEYDDEIYNDYEFYNFILKEFISTKEDMTNIIENTNSRMDLTLQFLLNRNKSKKHKDIDTRASKNRKLRFDKHEKIINFMVPYPNHKINAGRIEILNSIFGGFKRKNNEEEVDYDSDFEII